MSLTAEIVAVGTELVAGEAVDTNSAWLSRRLGELGIRVLRHTSVADDLGHMVTVLSECARRAEAVVMTGGLGPTPDDLTRHAAAAVAGVPLERRQDLVDRITGYFAAAGRDMPPSNLVQADVPEGARVLPAQGTAPGFAFDVDRASVYCLPGVPREMQAMAEADLIPELAARAGRGVTVSRLVRTAGMAESHVAELVSEVLDPTGGGPAVAYLASKGETRVRITTTAPDRAAALARINPLVDRIVDRLGAGVAGLDDEGPEHAVVRQLRQAGLTLAVAESMTAGGVAARIARVPGASMVLLGGIVVYATASKTALAGVPAAVLDDHGPVSAVVAARLAAGVRDRLTADLGLGLVGVAGPAQQGGVPVGRVHLALDTGGQVYERELNLSRRSREDIQDFAVSAAVDFVRRRVATWAARKAS